MGHVALNDYLIRIERLLADNRLAETVAHCRHILSQYPRHTATYRLYARALFEQQDFAGAIDLFQRVLSAEPADMIAHAGLAHAYHETGEPERAIWHLERAHEQEPYNRAIRHELQRLYAAVDSDKIPLVGLGGPALARIHFRSSRYGQAAQEAEAILRRIPDRLDLQVLQAEALFQDGRPAEALRLSMQVVETLPYCVSANAILAAVWRNTGQDSAAEKHLRRVWSCTLLDAEGRDPGSVVGQAFLSDGRFSLPDRLYVEELDYTPAAGMIDFAGADWVQELQASGFLEQASADDGAGHGVPAGTPAETARPADLSAWEPDEELLAWLEQVPGLSSAAVSDFQDEAESEAAVFEGLEQDVVDFETRLFGPEDGIAGPGDDVAPAAGAGGEAAPTERLGQTAPETETAGDRAVQDMIEGPSAPEARPEDDVVAEPLPGDDLLVWLEDVLEQGSAADQPGAESSEAEIFFEPGPPPAESGTEPSTATSENTAEGDTDQFLVSPLNVGDVLAEGAEGEDHAPADLPGVEQEELAKLPDMDEAPEQDFIEPDVHSTMVGVYEEPLVIEPDVTPDDLAQLLMELTPEESAVDAAIEPPTEGVPAGDIPVGDETNVASESGQTLAALLDELSQVEHDRDAAATPPVNLEEGPVETDMSDWLSEVLGTEQEAEPQPQGATGDAEIEAVTPTGEAEPALSSEDWDDLMEEAAGRTEDDMPVEEGMEPAIPAGDFDWLSELAAQTGEATEAPPPDASDSGPTPADQPPAWFSAVLEDEATESDEAVGEPAAAGEVPDATDDVPDWLQELAEKSRPSPDEDE